MKKFGTWMNGFIMGTSIVIAAESLGVLAMVILRYDISEKSKD